jgi:hypothetical protein
LGSVSYSRWIPPGPIYYQAFVTTAAFPVVAWLFQALRRVLSTAPERL